VPSLIVSVALNFAVIAGCFWFYRRCAAERLRAQDSERHLASELLVAGRQLDALAYALAQELRVPLRSVDGFAQVLEKEYSQRLDREGFRMLARVRAGVTKAAQLMDDLLRLIEAGRRPLQPEHVDMTALAQEAAAEFIETYPRSIVDIRVMPHAWGDPSLIKSVWVQVIGNALKFSANATAPRVYVGAREDRGGIQYWVRDNGVGFDPAHCEKLFGVFQRLHRPEEYAGSGIGLAMVQLIVTRHGGRVEAVGKPGQGAEIRFRLPASLQR
jgi:light-regulated signal transduction histidine kinase (bacteriophytochrome)